MAVLAVQQELAELAVTHPVDLAVTLAEDLELAVQRTATLQVR